MLSIAILAYISFVNATKANLVQYLLLFILIFVFCMLFVFLIIGICSKELPNSYKIFVAFVLSIIPIGLLALNTIGQISVLNVIFIIAIPLLLLWYGSKHKFL